MNRVGLSDRERWPLHPEIRKLAENVCHVCVTAGSLLNPADPREAAILSYAREHVMEVEGDVPHAWLFMHCAVVVHHGG